MKKTYNYLFCLAIVLMLMLSILISPITILGDKDIEISNFEIKEENEVLYENEQIEDSIELSVENDTIIFNEKNEEDIFNPIEKQESLAFASSTETASNARIVVEEIDNTGEYVLTKVESISTNSTNEAIVATDTNIVEIGMGAFRGFKDVSKINLSSLTHLRKISKRAFANCPNLAEIILPSSVEEIEEEAFLGTKWLDNQRSTSQGHIVAINDIIVDGRLAEGNIEISGDRYNKISRKAFANNYRLTSVKLSNFSKIENESFIGCTNITSVEINNCTTIGNFAFYGCKSLEEVKVNVLTTIGDDAFSRCSSLKYVYTIESEINRGLLDTNISVIGKRAFAYCTSLEWFKLPDTNITIDIGAFAYCTSLERVEFKNTNMNAKTICECAFMNCTKLTTIENMDLNKTTIKNGAFIGSSFI